MANDLIDQHELKIELPKGSSLKALSNKVAELMELYGPYPTIDGLRLSFYRTVPAAEETSEQSERRFQKQVKEAQPNPNQFEPQKPVEVQEERVVVTTAKKV